MSLEDMSIAELEIRIQLANIALRWLRSDDPMLTDENYRHLVKPAIARVTDEIHQLTAVCREKKVQRDQSQREFIENVEVGMQTARLKLKRL